jgi:hypothetical protein
VSLIFVGVALGFILATPAVDRLQARLGRSCTLCLSNLVLCAGYMPIVLAAPFGAIVPGYLLTGFGLAVNLSVSNVL